MNCMLRARVCCVYFLIRKIYEMWVTTETRKIEIGAHLFVWRTSVTRRLLPRHLIQSKVAHASQGLAKRKRRIGDTSVSRYSIIATGIHQKISFISCFIASTRFDSDNVGDYNVFIGHRSQHMWDPMIRAVCSESQETEIHADFEFNYALL